MKKSLIAVLVVMMFSAVLRAADTLEIFVIDTEGGKAVLLVSPTGQSMLIDAGFPGFDGRDAKRVEEACQAAGVKQLDFLVVTHYDLDHVNNVPAVVGRIPVVTFVDHGPAVVNDAGTVAAVKAYDQVVAKARHMVVKAGDTIPFAGVDVLVLSSAGKVIKTPVEGGGIPNPFAATPAKMFNGSAEDTAENAQSVGLLFTFGKFRMVDLADLTWNKELELMCPVNPIGTVDLFMVSHHGFDISNSPALVHALKPRVSIMNNGARKFGTPAAMKVIGTSPGLEAFYQLHFSVVGGEANKENAGEEFIANTQSSPDGKWIKVSAQKGGAFTVTNGRTGVAKLFK